MATIFSSPEIGDPRAVGVKNGGVKEFTSDIIYPVSRITDKEFTASKQLEFRWRSDSSRFWSPRDTKLMVSYEVAFGKAADLVDNFAHDDTRITAAPNTCLFDGGMKYIANSTVIENQTEPYTAAMAQLLTKTDISGTDTSGSNSLLSLRKDVGKALGSTGATGTGSVPSLLPEVNTDADDPQGAKYASATTLAGIAHAAGTATS